MKTTKKALLLALCAVLLVVSTVFATMAYLTSTTDVVKNTFTVGNVKITLDESKVDEYGVVDTNADRVTENTYKLMPGHTYVKDPTIHVAKESEVCYLFIKVTNDIAEIEADGYTVADQLAANQWVVVDEANGIYGKEASVDARKAAVDVVVFSSIVIDTNADVSSYYNKTVTVQACAIQADGFNNMTEAWTAGLGSQFPTK
jgi:hypothetical protein